MATTLSALNAASGTLAVTAGGTGKQTLTQHGVLIGNGTSALTILAVAAAGTLLSGVASSDPAFTATPVLGIAGTVVGTIGFENATSGRITLSPPTGALGSVTLTLPLGGTLATLAGTETLTNKTLTSPILTTPALGVATAASINKVALTAPASAATLTISDGKTLTASNTLTLAGTDSTTMTFPPASASIGYLGVPQNSQSTAYTTVLSDAGKHILHPTADNNARTFTIDSNANVAYPVGTVLTFVNQMNTVTIAITSDTMTLMGAGTTGSRTLAASGIATALKVTSTSWVISGTGLT